MRINRMLNEALVVSRPKLRRVLLEKTGMLGDMNYDELFKVTNGKVLFNGQKSVVVSSITKQRLLSPNRPPNAYDTLCEIRISSRVWMPNHKIPKCINSIFHNSKLRSYATLISGDGREVPASDVTVETFWEDFINESKVLGYHFLAIDTLVPAFEKLLQYERDNIGDIEDIVIDVFGARDIVLATYIAENDLRFPHPSTIF